MPSINFVDAVTHVPADWANAVDALVFDIFQGSQDLHSAQVAFELGTLGKQDYNAVDITGGQMEGVEIGLFVPRHAQFIQVLLTEEPTNIHHAATKYYVDSRIGNSGLLPDQAGHAGEYLTTDGSLSYWSAVTPGSQLPDPAGHAGQFLQTNGSTFNWASVSLNSLLPPQTGNAGRALVTDGTNASWQPVAAAGFDTRPRFGLGSATAGVTTPATLFAAMSAIPGSANDGRAGAFALVTTGGTFGWVAVRASVTVGGLRFFDGIGYGGWSGASSPGNNVNPTQDPSTSTVLYTDGNGIQWRFFRQDFGNSNPTPGNYVIF